MHVKNQERQPYTNIGYVTPSKTLEIIFNTNNSYMRIFYLSTVATVIDFSIRFRNCQLLFYKIICTIFFTRLYNLYLYICLY